MSKSRAYLKGVFSTGYKPTQVDYSDLFDSFYNLNDDITIRTMGLSIDGQGSTIQSAASAGFSVPVYNGTIQSWTIVGDVSGSIVIDIKRNGVSIVGAGNKPTVTSATSATATVSGWTSVSVVAGDFIEYQIISSSNFTRANLSIKLV